MTTPAHSCPVHPITQRPHTPAFCLYCWKNAFPGFSCVACNVPICAKCYDQLLKTNIPEWRRDLSICRDDLFVFMYRRRTIEAKYLVSYLPVNELSHLISEYSKPTAKCEMMYYNEHYRLIEFTMSVSDSKWEMWFDHDHECKELNCLRNRLSEVWRLASCGQMELNFYSTAHRQGQH